MNDNHIRCVIFILAVLLFVSGGVLSFSDKVSAAGVNYGAGFLCLVFVYISQFKSFKGFGIEAELQEKIDEAEGILKRLREVTLPITNMLFILLSKQGRWSRPMPRSKQLEIINKIDAELGGIGAEHSRLEEAKKEWHSVNIYDLYEVVLQKIRPIFSEELKNRELKIKSLGSVITPEIYDEHSKAINHRNEVNNELAKFNESLERHNETDVCNQFLSMVKESKVLQENRPSILDDIKDEFDDLDYYIKYKKFRRLDVWLAEDEH
ncbi:hypothetical protein ACTVP2_07970 [Serratia marcescens]|uniref:hypothetical protein n=1 Tax=Serratia marcescens TaxID=615 RepID=UPI003FA6A709